MKKIGIMSDIHGNFYALQVIMKEFRNRNCDEIIHTGDMVDIGCNPVECVDYLLNSDVVLVNGNHDVNYINYDINPPPSSHVPSEHKKYIFEMLGDKYRERMRYLPLIVYRNIYGVKFAFLHYGFKKANIYRSGNFEAINPTPTAEFFDELYNGIDADVVFFGHKHEPIELVGERTYVDVGSVACHEYDYCRGIILTVEEGGKYSYERLAIPYDREYVRKTMYESGIPCSKELFEFYYREDFRKKLK